MNKLFAIVYVSTMTHNMSIGEIEYLLERARERNKEHQVTGLLLCYKGTFMQYIEGPDADLNFIYDIIKADNNHHNIIQIVHTAISAREFSDWSMAYSVASKKQIDALTQQSWLESDERKSTGRALLSEFWKVNALGRSIR
ncbi:MAG TPA: BLUF domain-containing protein [Cellvibrio sp.]|nr:BLUF domain-containing protein [Cellvibrio sp.]